MNPLNIILLIIWALSAIVLMHSGKGTGVSDMIASSLYNASTGSSVLERNLDRLTIIAAIVFSITILVFMFTFPQGTIV